MIRLAVPLVAQGKDKTCWHASATMLWLYSQSLTKRAGPMCTLTDKWSKNEAVYPQEFITLAKRAGLAAISIANYHTAADLEVLLKKHGPIWCAGYWYGVGHIIVLTGIESGTVYLNDPDQGKEKTGTIAWFNEKLSSQLSGCMMVKDASRY